MNAESLIDVVSDCYSSLTDCKMAKEKQVSTEISTAGENYDGAVSFYGIVQSEK